jgi:hypothetical protein
MNTNHKSPDDFSAPIRTRGPIPKRGARKPQAAALPGAAIPRGAVRTRGAVRIGPAGVPEGPPIPLARLLLDIREQVGGLPLTLLLHGWGSGSTKAFLASLLPELRARDADSLWLVPLAGRREPHSLPAFDKTVELDMSLGTHLKFYNNLVGDLVFFPAVEEGETESAAAWEERARALIVDERGLLARVVLQAATEAGLIAYRWPGGPEVMEV